MIRVVARVIRGYYHGDNGVMLLIVSLGINLLCCAKTMYFFIDWFKSVSCSILSTLRLILLIPEEI